MASIKIDLGFGEQAILSERTVSGSPAVKHKRDAEEFLRRWPRTRSIQQAQGYLRQLGLHVAYKPPGVNPSDTIALLQSAVKSGRVMVVIERAATRFGGCGGAPHSTGRSGAIASSRQSFAEMAGVGRLTSSTLSDAASAPASYSWLQRYDDVSADDLINYIQSVVGSTPGDAAVPDADPPTPLGDAQSFDYAEDVPSGDVEQIAASTNNPNFAAKMLGYDRKTFGNMVHTTPGVRLVVVSFES